MASPPAVGGVVVLLKQVDDHAEVRQHCSSCGQGAGK